MRLARILNRRTLAGDVELRAQRDEAVVLTFNDGRHSLRVRHIRILSCFSRGSGAIEGPSPAQPRQRLCALELPLQVPLQRLQREPSQILPAFARPGLGGKS